MSDFETIWPEWKVEELLGRGSYGKVYRISRESLGHKSLAAAKLIEIPQDESELVALASLGMDNLSIRTYLENTARSIINEIAVMESLKGARNIVAIEDYRLVEHTEDVGWTIWIRMELLEGLVEYQRRNGAPSVEESVKIASDVCNALMICHEKGIIHRDVKPENVFRSPFGEYKLGDFGIAKQIEQSTKSTYSQKGTQQYMAPEVVRGDKYDGRADIYSLGMMLYRFLNKMRFPFLPPAPQPFTADDMEKALFRRLKGDDLPVPSEADAALAEIVLKACQANPSKRYQSAQEFYADLSFWSEGRYNTGEHAQVIESYKEQENPKHREFGKQEERRIIDWDKPVSEGETRKRDSENVEEAKKPLEDSGAVSEASVGKETGFRRFPVFVLPIALVAIVALAVAFLHPMTSVGEKGPSSGSEYVGEWYVPTDTDRFISISANGDVSYGDDNHGIIASGKWVVIDEEAGAIKLILTAQDGCEEMFEEGAGEFTRMVYAESDERLTAQLYYSPSEWETYIRK